MPITINELRQEVARFQEPKRQAEQEKLRAEEEDRANAEKLEKIKQKLHDLGYNDDIL